MAMLSRHHLIQEAVDGAVVVGSAGAMGLIHGRKGEMPKIGPVPADAAIGVGSALIGVSGVGGHQVQRHAFNVAKGTLSYFVGSIFAQVGQKMRVSAKEMVGGAVATDGTLTGGATSRTVTKGTPLGMPHAVSAHAPLSPNSRDWDPAEVVARVTQRRAA